MDVWSVAFVRNNELSKHHSRCFIICLLNKNGEAIVSLMVKLNWKTTTPHLKILWKWCEIAKEVITNLLLFVEIKLIYLYKYVHSHY
jgi:hypothetical protein